MRKVLANWKVVAVVLIAVSLLVVTVAVSTATNAKQDANDNLAYLPIIARACIDDHTIGAYVTVDRPVVRIGETFTVTTAFVSEECASVGLKSASVDIGPQGLPHWQIQYMVESVNPYHHAEVQFVFQAAEPGIGIVTAGGGYEYPHAYNNVVSATTTIRILP